MPNGSGILDCDDGKMLLDQDTGKLRLQQTGTPACCDDEETIRIRLQAGNHIARFNAVTDVDEGCTGRVFDTNFDPDARGSGANIIFRWDSTPYESTVQRGVTITDPDGNTYEDRVVITTPPAQVYFLHQVLTPTQSEAGLDCLRQYINPDDDPGGDGSDGCVPSVNHQCPTTPVEPAFGTVLDHGATLGDINRADGERQDLGTVRLIIVLRPAVASTITGLANILSEIQRQGTRCWFEASGNLLTLNRGYIPRPDRCAQGSGSHGSIRGVVAPGSGDPGDICATRFVQRTTRHRFWRPSLPRLGRGNGGGSPFANLASVSSDSFDLAPDANWTSSGVQLCDTGFCSRFDTQGNCTSVGPTEPVCPSRAAPVCSCCWSNFAGTGRPCDEVVGQSCFETDGINVQRLEQGECFERNRTVPYDFYQVNLGWTMRVRADL